MNYDDDMNFASLSLLGLLACSLGVYACGSASADSSAYSGQGVGGGAAGASAGGGSAGAAAGAGAGAGGGAAGGASGGSTGGAAGSGVEVGGQGGSSQGKTIIYAHTDTQLYQLDPDDLSTPLELVGEFDCVGDSSKGQDPAMTDLAVDRDANLWGISARAVHPLTIANGKILCGAPIDLETGDKVSFYGLTFAPAGTLDPDVEVLVAGNTAGELWAIDGKGKAVQRGTFGNAPKDDGHGHAFEHPGKAFELSGDIVFVSNGGNPIGYATVRDCPNPPSTSGCSSINTLIEIDVKKMATATSGSVRKSVRGQIVQRKGCNDGVADDAYGNMYGIAAWADKVFGFSRVGNLVEIDVDDGSGCRVKGYDMSKFSGAGVTTLVKVEPPIN